jgi:hypothetical protein
VAITFGIVSLAANLLLLRPQHHGRSLKDLAFAVQ